MKIQSKTKLNHKGEQSEVGYINLLQDGYLTIDNLERGDYVLTMYVQCDSIGNISIGEQSQDITTSWNKVSYILSNVEDVINIKFKKGVYYIYEVKLEKGNKATDWTPAPEDTEESINNVNTNASTALTNANNANTKAQGIIDNIYTPNTTTIDGGKITTGTITAAQIAAGTITSNEIAAGTITAEKINLNDLFAQNITATGTITGATLKGAHVEATSGFIGNWNIINGSIVNEVTEDKGNQLLITRKTELKANSSLVFSTIDYAGNHTTEISGNNIICASSVAESTIRPNEIKVIGTAILGNPYSSITPSDIYEGSVALKDKYVSQEQINGITSFNIVNGELYIVANGVKYKFAPDGVIV